MKNVKLDRAIPKHSTCLKAQKISEALQYLDNYDFHLQNFLPGFLEGVAA